ncbi:hypothetical protein FV139_00580 [Parahaliea maris]|uniref:Uncharacterized protein n=1 Tax=Parahaliea maris TaxID=2716870 RepID=A0A5C9A8Y5_9GAMM|nr:hypothetical protein [Parahaliea maris]TXS96037.1 hypothetical protein FV139_00580 [Parahaliea maris]
MDTLAEREKHILAQADALNAILSQTNIPQAAQAAEMRSREQAASRLARQRAGQSRDDLLLAEALRRSRDKGAGPFKGTGMEAQMLNEAYRQSVGGGQMSHDDFMRDVASQRLGRQTTVATPEGTYITPGYDTSFMGGRRGTPDFVPKPPTEGEKRGQYTTSNLRQLNNAASEMVPSITDAAAEQYAPEFLKGYFTSDEYKAMNNRAREWAATLVFMRSGATARKDEVDAAMQNFWPQPGDGPQDVQRKAQMREEAMATAEAAYAQRQGGTPPGTGQPPPAKRVIKFGDLPPGS